MGESDTGAREVDACGVKGDDTGSRGVKACGMDEPIRIEQRGTTVVITLNRPEAANALSRQLLYAMSEKLGVLQAAHPSDVRTVVLTGAGNRAFCAGADLKERRTMNEEAVVQTVQLIRKVVQQVADLPMPVIAAINGAAFGGGLELALAADLRIAASTAHMGLTETTLAIIPGAGGTQRLSRLIGLCRAKELIFTGRRVSAEEAFLLGIVNQVVTGEALIDSALALGEAIGKNGPIALRQAKYAMDLGYEMPLPAAMAVEWQAYQAIIPTEDRQEGLRSFAEKRPPRYEGR